MNLVKKIFLKPHIVFTSYFFDFWEMVKKWRGLYYLFVNASEYNSKNKTAFRITFKDLYYRSYDRFSSAGSVPAHYFLQDIWAAHFIYSNSIKQVVDVGSRLDGYISHLLPFCLVTFIDIRPLDLEIHNLKVVTGSITNLPFTNDSIKFLSSLHVIEHIGLGRYGDQVDPLGHLSAAKELSRVLAPGGTLILSTVVGNERLCFDAHRIFDPATVLSIFDELKLEQFCLIDDKGEHVIENATIELGRACNYGCGIFIFKKPGT
ncbi:MAG TPA: DUF268 domain-containing protein [Chitinophagaceae bacterium]|nr:DUF268 domain-containing protein [Chitinophagaceae bacterium]